MRVLYSLSFTALARGPSSLSRRGAELNTKRIWSWLCEGEVGWTTELNGFAGYRLVVPGVMLR